jgi:hypothetical protein
LSARHNTPSSGPRRTPVAQGSNPYAQNDAEDLREQIQRDTRLLDFAKIGSPDNKRHPEIQRLEKTISMNRQKLRNLAALQNSVARASASGAVSVARRKRKRGQRRKSRASPNRKHRSPNQEVANRRATVAANIDVRPEGLCQLFDENRTPLPKSMREAGTWSRAFKSRIHHHAVEVLIYRDRKAVRNPKI